MAWFDDLELPGSTITGNFAFVLEDGPDADNHPDIRLASGRVLFEPTAAAVRAGGAWIGIAPVEAVLFDGELITSEDNPQPPRILSTEADTGVENWGWKATFDISGASIKPIRFRAPISGVHLTGNSLIPLTGHPVEVIDVGRAVVERLVTAEDLIEGQEQRLSTVEATVNRIKLANQSAGEGAPTGTAPEGWVYTDLTTGDIYRMEA